MTWTLRLTFSAVLLPLATAKAARDVVAASFLEAVGLAAGAQRDGSAETWQGAVCLDVGVSYSFPGGEDVPAALEALDLDVLRGSGGPFSAIEAYANHADGRGGPRYRLKLLRGYNVNGRTCWRRALATWEDVP